MGKYTAWKMKAAICDDTVEDAEFIEKHIKDYFMKKGIPYECNVYQSSKALWYEIEDGQAFDLLFLDIEMQELNGFELAAKIQETAPDILIIFVSAYESYVYKSFEFRPFQFYSEATNGKYDHTGTGGSIQGNCITYLRGLYCRKSTGHRKNPI